MKKLKLYYRLTKPGIIYGNLLTTVAGFLLASQGHIDWVLFASTIMGVSLVMASACVFNNYIDRDIDRMMDRTKKRALVDGTISSQSALIFATLLGVAGFAVLAAKTNTLTVILGVIAILVYVVLYGIAKRKSVHGTLVGSVAGALPPVAGYTAVTNQMDIAAWSLFIILTVWQMPHFYAIALFRLKDYQAAHIPVLPAIKGAKTAMWQIRAYIVLFSGSTLLLTLFDYTGYTYAFVMAGLSIVWLKKSFDPRFDKNPTGWARRLFTFSLIILTTFSILLSMETLLP